MCPDCGTKIQCGTGGLQNLNKRHRGGQKCINARRKRDKDARNKKDGSILAFMKPKPATVPSTVPPAPLIRAAPGYPRSIKRAEVLSQSSSTDINHNIGGFLDRFQRIVGALSEHVPVGNSSDRLAAFRSPEQLDDPNIESEDLWEERLNGFMKENLGWGTEVNAADLVRRGEMGMDGILKFTRYFVEKRGVNASLFEGKLGHLLLAAETL